MKKIGLYFLTGIFFILGGCGSNKIHTFELSSFLVDYDKLNIKVEVKFKNESGVKELKEKIDKVEYAFKLLFKDVKASDLQKLGRRKVLKAMKMILKSQMREKPTGISVLKYEVILKNKG